MKKTLIGPPFMQKYQMLCFYTAKTSCLITIDFLSFFSSFPSSQIQMNCWIFLIAGYETSSTALAYLTHALCQHPKVQEKLAAEVQKSQYEERLQGRDGCISYASVLKMEYLHQVVCETLRMYPPAPSVMRRQSVDPVQLKVPGGTVLVRKELRVCSI